MTTFLTAAEVLFIHARLVSETGGEHGVRDIGLLQSTVARPQATFDGRELYPDLFQKAAVLMHSLAQNHPFVDGKKRTAITSAALFLLRNGWQLQTTNEALEQFTLSVTDGSLDVAEIAAWFQNNSLPSKN